MGAEGGGLEEKESDHAKDFAEMWVITKKTRKTRFRYIKLQI